MLTDIYNILILPIEYLMEIVFLIIYRFFDNIYAAIAGLSLFVGVVTLPLFNKAEQISAGLREKKDRLKDRSERIKRCFKGDERTMILSAYYKLNAYSPLSDIMTLLPLILQIPFFVAAYRFLSGTGLLKDGFLGQADALISIGQIRINLLPLLMTLINLLSAAVYTKGGERSERVSVLISALVFLVILYDSPSGLVLYWTLNNVFSLVKNIFLKRVNNKRKAVVIVLKLAVAVYFFWFVLSARILTFIFTERYDRLLIGFLPILVLFVGYKNDTESKEITLKEYIKKGLAMLIPLTILAGVYIPLKVLEASPMEFVNVFDYLSPFVYVRDNMEAVAGLLLIWLPVVIISAGKKAEKTGAVICAAVAGAFVAFFAFGGNRQIDNMMLFDDNLTFTLKDLLINLLVIVTVIVAFYFAYRFYKRFAVQIALVLSGTLLLAAVFSVAGTYKEIHAGLNKTWGTTTDGKEFIPLSRNGNNIALIVLDRAIGRYVPYIFAERPEIKEQFDGFTWYPDTISFGGYTILGAPALYGGYEYTPQSINDKTDEKLITKLNESSFVTGAILTEEGYKVSMIDPQYAGEKDKLADAVSAVSDISTYNLYLKFSGNNTSEKKDLKEKSLFLYVFYEMLPRINAELLYKDGRYMSVEADSNYYLAYNDSMEELKRMPDYFRVEDEGNTFFTIHNLLPHSPASLARNDYKTLVEDAKMQYSEDGITVDGVTMKIENEEQLQHFQVNVASYMWLGRWFDWLRENGIYDNTRIIIVADHGWPLGQFDDMMLDDDGDREAYNPLFMVKDFGSTGFDISYDFMTNADTVGLMLQGIVDDPVNPFTTKPIDAREKEGIQMITTSKHLNDMDHGEYTYNLEDGYWYEVDGDLFDESKWRHKNDAR